MFPHCAEQPWNIQLGIDRVQQFSFCESFRAEWEVAIIGASNDRTKFGNKAFRAYRRQAGSECDRGVQHSSRRAVTGKP
jgi:hypothetical protein